MMRYIQKAICGAKTFSDTPIYSQLQNIIFTTVEDQQPHEFQPVFETFPEIRLTLDIGHANLGGGKNRSSEFIRLHGYRIGHVHANDNFGKEDSHLPIGAGIIDFERIMKELKEAHYDETITLEVFSRDRDYLKISKEKIKRMWEAL
jgi:endonuclease IV